ncbi:hypothetical protein DFR85_11055 [Acidianus brierleyi]|nr:hypothetical protein DFR85_11055 [Acidianus brierleyi]
MINGIKGLIDLPGEIPWEIILAYYIIAPTLVFLIAKRRRALKNFTTLDWVYIGIGAAAGVVWEFYLGAFIDRVEPKGIEYFIDPGFWGRMIILFVIAGVVRKTGVGMVSLTVFTFLSDLFHYGFGGEPLYFFYEALTYGLFIDAIIAFTGGKPFGISSKTYPKILAAIEGAIVGILWGIPDPIIYEAFYRPFIYGAVVDWQKVYFDLYTHLAFIWIAGLIGGLIAYRIEKAIQI